MIIKENTVTFDFTELHDQFMCFYAFIMVMTPDNFSNLRSDEFKKILSDLTDNFIDVNVKKEKSPVKGKFLECFMIETEKILESTLKREGLY